MQFPSPFFVSCLLIGTRALFFCFVVAGAAILARGHARPEGFPLPAKARLPLRLPRSG